MTRVYATAVVGQHVFVGRPDLVRAAVQDDLALLKLTAWVDDRAVELTTFDQLWRLASAHERNAKMRSAYRQRQLARRRRGRR